MSRTTNEQMMNAMTEEFASELNSPENYCDHGINLAAFGECCDECNYWDARERVEEDRFDAMHDGDFDDYPFWMEAHHESS